MGGAPVKDEKPLKKWETKYLTVWDDVAKKHVSMSLVESVEDTFKNWSAVDYGVGSDVYDEDSKGVTSAMKKLGYYPTKKARGGAYYFEHYTKRKKDTNGEGTSA